MSAKLIAAIAAQQAARDKHGILNPEPRRVSPTFVLLATVGAFTLVVLAAGSAPDPSARAIQAVAQAAQNAAGCRP